MTEEEKDLKRKKDRDRRKKSDLKKRQNYDTNKAQKSSFLTPQVKGKLKKRTKEALNGTNDQNFEVLQDLMTEFDSPDFHKKNGSKCMEQTTIDAVEAFYYNDDISRSSPNSNDFVSLKVDGKKIKKSVKHLLYPIKEVQAMFLSENPDMKISLSKFYQLRPKEILINSKLPNYVCCCQIHENLRLRLKTLQKSDEIFKNLSVDSKMHLNFTCENPGKECFDNKCESCSNGSKIQELCRTVTNNCQDLTWSQWESATKNCSDEIDHVNTYCNIEKKKKKGSFKELLEEICRSLPEFLQHEYIKINQSKISAELVSESMKHDSFSAVI